jgi:hypothetical protein
MRIQWNSFEPAIPLDIGDDSDPPDYVVELNLPNGSQATVKSTQINGAGEVWLKVNGAPGSSGVKPKAHCIGKYAIRCYSYENDEKASVEVPITEFSLKGKTLRLTVDVCL